MNQNFFHTKLPFYPTSNYANQPMLMKNKPEADETYLYSTPNPSTWYPEFVMHRAFTASNIQTLQVWNVSTDTLHQNLNVVGLITFGFITQYQIKVGTQQRIVVMFSGLLAPSSPMSCGLYQYRLEDKDGRKYYSEYFEVHPDIAIWSFAKDHWTRLNYRSTCYFNKINYSGNRYFTNWLWLNSSALVPESTIAEETVVNAAGETVAKNHRLEKRFLMSLPNVSQPMMDAINTLPMYTGGENLSLQVYSNTLVENQATTVLTIAVEKPDYTKNECAPSLKLRFQIDPDIADAGCCDTSEIYCYSSVPSVGKPLLSKSAGKLVVTASISEEDDWYLTDGLIPPYAVITVLYKLTAAGSWTTYSEQFSSSELASGAVIDLSLPAGDYHAAIKVGAFGCSDSPQSATSVTVTLP
jgi:hypothetical protein